MIKTVAKFDANIETQHGLRRAEQETFHVVARAARGLLGFGTATRMGLIRIGTELNKVEEEEEFPKIPNSKIKLEVDESIQPTRNCEYKIPWALQAITQQQLDKLESKKIIETAPDNTAWMSRLSSVEKGSGERKPGEEPERRLVVNMKGVNAAIKRVNHPMPYLENFLPMLHGARIFTKLDISSAFYHVELHEESRNLTTFMTAKGPMRFTRLPFGINAAPEIFQKTMEAVLVDDKAKPLPGVIVYIDDILIFANDGMELDERTEAVVGKLRKNKMTPKRSYLRTRHQQGWEQS